MDPLSRARHLRAFRATDAFAVETYRVANAVNAAIDPGLVRSLREAAARSGASLVAATAAGEDRIAQRGLVERARIELLESRYFLYLARRIGVLGVKHYRNLASRHDVALREIEAMLEAPPRAEEMAM